MAPWKPLGGPWAPTLLPAPSRSPPGEALGRPGASRKLLLAALGRPWGEKLIDFTLPGTCLEGPGGALGRHFHSFFAVGPAGAKKVRKLHVLGNVFSSSFYVFCLSLVRLTGGASASAHLEKPRFGVEGMQNFACRPFSRATKKQHHS